MKRIINFLICLFCVYLCYLVGIGGFAIAGSDEVFHIIGQNNEVKIAQSDPHEPSTTFDLRFEEGGGIGIASTPTYSFDVFAHGIGARTLRITDGEGRVLEKKLYGNRREQSVELGDLLYLDSASRGNLATIEVIDYPSDKIHHETLDLRDKNKPAQDRYAAIRNGEATINYKVTYADGRTATGQRTYHITGNQTRFDAERARRNGATTCPDRYRRIDNKCVLDPDDPRNSNENKNQNQNEEEACPEGYVKEGSRCVVKEKEEEKKEQKEEGYIYNPKLEHLTLPGLNLTLATITRQSTPKTVTLEYSDGTKETLTTDYTTTFALIDESKGTRKITYTDDTNTRHEVGAGTKIASVGGEGVEIASAEYAQRCLDPGSGIYRTRPYHATCVEDTPGVARRCMTGKQEPGDGTNTCVSAEYTPGIYRQRRDIVRQKVAGLSKERVERAYEAVYDFRKSASQRGSLSKKEKDMILYLMDDFLNELDKRKSKQIQAYLDMKAYFDAMTYGSQKTGNAELKDNETYQRYAGKTRAEIEAYVERYATMSRDYLMEYNAAFKTNVVRRVQDQVEKGRGTPQELTKAAKEGFVAGTREYLMSYYDDYQTIAGLTFEKVYQGAKNVWEYVQSPKERLQEWRQRIDQIHESARSMTGPEGAKAISYVSTTIGLTIADPVGKLRGLKFVEKIEEYLGELIELFRKARGISNIAELFKDIAGVDDLITTAKKYHINVGAGGGATTIEGGLQDAQEIVDDFMQNKGWKVDGERISAGGNNRVQNYISSDGTEGITLRNFQSAGSDANINAGGYQHHGTMDIKKRNGTKLEKDSEVKFLLPESQ